jgi:hypothetical protein
MKQEKINAKAEATRLTNLFAKEAANLRFSKADKSAFERLKVKLKRHKA